MTERLRDLMERAGAEAPMVHVPDDTWQRARRRRAMELVLVPGLVMVVLALAGLTTVSFVDGPEGVAPAGTEGEPALPTQLYDVSNEAEPATDLALGQLSLVWSEAGGLVGVRAVDGAYVVFDIPHHGGSVSSFDAATLALSPDGTALAYANSKGVGARLSVVDLETGEVQLYVEGQGMWGSLSYLTWSADGSSVAYRGHTASDDHFWGSTDLATGKDVRWPVDPLRTAAMGYDGSSLVHATGREHVIRAHAGGSSTDLGRPRVLFSVNPGHTMLDTPAGVVLLCGEDVCLFPERGQTRTVDADQRPDFLVGATDQMATTVATLEDGRTLLEGHSLVGDDAAGWRLTSEQSGVFSVAQDLTDAPLRDFPEPDWPTSPRTYVLGGFGVLIALIVPATWWWERRIRR